MVGWRGSTGGLASDVKAITKRVVESEEDIILRQCYRGLLDASRLASVTRTHGHDTSDEDEVGEMRIRSGGARGHGPPGVVRVGGRRRGFADGAGLCSPGRWTPERRRLVDWLLRAWLLVALKAILVKHVEVKRLVCMMAVGKVTQNPFSDEMCVEGRAALIRSLGMASHDEGLLEVPEGQCFFLKLIGELLHVAGDPDWRVYSGGRRNFGEGVPLGYREPLPRTPAVFRRKVKWRQYDDDKLQWQQPGHYNYGQADERRKATHTQFESERLLDMMIETTGGSPD